MYQKTGRRVGLALLATAVVVRSLASTGVDALAARAMAADFDAPRFADVTLALATGAAVPPEPVPEQQVWVLKILPEEEKAAPEAVPMVFSAREAEDIGIGGKCSYKVDKAALLTAPTGYTPSTEPTVLIVHTHTSEAYTQTAGWTYTETDPLRTTEDAHSVVRVGQELKTALESRGIGVIHDTTYNDYPDYNGAYGRTLEKTRQWLENYPSVQVVLDVHRDAMEDAYGAPVREAETLSDGTAAARLMLVVGTDEGGLSHPNWQSNLSLALKIQAAANRREPGLCKDIDLRTERFNQHASSGALLVEVGSTGNSLPEALAAARVLAGSLADVLVGG